MTLSLPALSSRPNAADHNRRSPLRLQIQCLSPVLQLAFVHLAETAHLTVCETADAPLLTDDASLVKGDRPILWVLHDRSRLENLPPGQIRARLDLLIQPDELRQAVETVTQGQTWGRATAAPALTERELEMLSLLTQGHRDRDIADRLMISESTVKFHLNNAMTKLGARTRYQAIYQAIQQGWLI